MFTTALDQTIVATAVPTITSELHSASGYVWIGGAYMLANAAGGPIWAKISDIWGRKPVLLTAVAMFFGSSIICAEARSMKMLIIGRSLRKLTGKQDIFLFGNFLRAVAPEICLGNKSCRKTPNEAIPDSPVI